MGVYWETRRNRCGHVGDAAIWLEKAGLELDVITHNITINASEESGDTHLNSNSSDTSSCDKWKLAVSLSEDMDLNKVKPDFGSVELVMRALVAASLFQAGFNLLDQIENGRYGSLKNMTYTAHLTLQRGLLNQGCLSLAYDVQKRMCNLQALEAVVTADTDAQTYRNGFARHLNHEMTAFYSKLAERTSYAPCYRALPFGFWEPFALGRKRKAEAEKKAKESLRWHAEKKALIDFLKNEADEDEGRKSPVALKVNFAMCADCHSFLAHSSEALERKIIVTALGKRHEFNNGTCSCSESSVEKMYSVEKCIRDFEIGISADDGATETLGDGDYNALWNVPLMRNLSFYRSFTCLLHRFFLHIAIPDTKLIQQPPWYHPSL